MSNDIEAISNYAEVTDYYAVVIAALVRTLFDNSSCKEIEEQEDVVGDRELTWGELSQAECVHIDDNYM